MAFLKLFCLASGESFKPLDTPCLPEEVTARFILSRSHFATSDRRVKARAFEPAPNDRTTSVFRTTGLRNAQVWEIGSIYVADPQDRNIHARAEVSVRSIQSLQLVVTPREPPPRHAIIQDWPDDKSAAMSIAQRLAAESTLVLPS